MMDLYWSPFKKIYIYAIEQIHMQKKLDVPICRQIRKNDCIPACMLMCFKYFLNMYKRSFIKSELDVLLNLPNMYKFVEYNPKTDGTDITDEWSERMNNKLSGLVLNLCRDCTIDEFKKRIMNDLPSIALYDSPYLMGGRKNRGHHHACVITGFETDKVIIIDPSRQKPLVPDIKRFESSLKNDPYNAILLDISNE